jgi:hypothetical protein
MDFLGAPDIGPPLFIGPALASFVTAFIGVYTGAAGRVILLASPAPRRIVTTWSLPWVR